MKTEYKNILLPYRMRESTIRSRKGIDEYLSDRSRIIYCSSFRRLQQKAQVFSLEPNSNVRTRLTHSLEVSDIGRTLARNICVQLQKEKILPTNSSIPEQIVAIVENACLLHDIGNPPFGHFGEAAIKKWVKDDLEEYAKKADVEGQYKKIENDFLEYDGNPQGLRTILRIHCEFDDYGLNLSFPTLLSCIKYPRSTGCNNSMWKKAGYFQSEKEIVEKMYCNIGIENGARYPLSYIMEAADDIAYSLSDISDGIEKGILTLNGFLEEFRIQWGEKPLPEGLLFNAKDIKNYNALSINWSKQLIKSAAQTYIDDHDNVWRGTKKDLFTGSYYESLLDTIKGVSRKILYRSDEAEKIELSGFAVISGLLKYFGELLKLKRKDFMCFIDEDSTPAGKGLDVQWRIFNRISPRSLKCYKTLSGKDKLQQFYTQDHLDEDTIEWWLRVHMILDHISGMTDRFALETFQMFTGMI